jgi:hypothetical protein
MLARYRSYSLEKRSAMRRPLFVILELLYWIIG